MESIKKYVENFKKSRKINIRYSLRGKELFLVSDEVKKDAFHTLLPLFEYGYAKGYRAAMSEMKRGGAA